MYRCLKKVTFVVKKSSEYNGGDCSQNLGYVIGMSSVDYFIHVSYTCNYFIPSVLFESLPNILCLFVCFFFSVPPLFVIEFLHRVVDTFTEYFSSCTETSIKDNVVIVFEVRKKGKESCQYLLWVLMLEVKYQRAVKVVSDSRGLVDFAIGLVNPVLHFWEIQITEEL